VFLDPEILLTEDARKNPCRQFQQTGEIRHCKQCHAHSLLVWHGNQFDLLTVLFITSHHIETTDAGLDGLCIREISVYHTNL